MTESSRCYMIIPTESIIISEINNDRENMGEYTIHLWWSIVTILVSTKWKIGCVIILTESVITSQVNRNREDMCSYSRLLCWSILNI